MKIFKTKKYSILSNILKYSFVFVIAISIFSQVALAVNPAVEGIKDPAVTGDNAPNINTKIDNPLGSGIDSIPKLIEAIINIVLMIGIPIVVLAIIYTGFLFVKAQGNPEQITKAKSALLYTLIGAALLLGAFVIANAIGKTVEEIKSST